MQAPSCIVWIILVIDLTSVNDSLHTLACSHKTCNQPARTPVQSQTPQITQVVYSTKHSLHSQLSWTLKFHRQDSLVSVLSLDSIHLPVTESSEVHQDADVLMLREGAYSLNATTVPHLCLWGQLNNALLLILVTLHLSSKQMQLEWWISEDIPFALFQGCFQQTRT